MAGAKVRVDYDRIEPDWRAGIKSHDVLAEEYTQQTGQVVTGAGIAKHFKKLGVERDLTAKINAKASALVGSALVGESVGIETNNDKRFAESEIIEVNAQIQASVLLSHRKDIKRGRVLAIKLLAEVEAQTDDPELFKQLGEILASPDEKGADKLNEIYRKVISTPGRIDSMKKLSETLKNLIALERQALGLSNDDLPDPGDTVVRIERVIVRNG